MKNLSIEKKAKKFHSFTIQRVSILFQKNNGLKKSIRVLYWQCWIDGVGYRAAFKKRKLSRSL